MQALADALNMRYMETSAKESTNVGELFASVTDHLVDTHKYKNMADSSTGDVLDSSALESSKPVRAKSLMSLNCFDCNIM